MPAMPGNSPAASMITPTPSSAAPPDSAARPAKKADRKAAADARGATAAFRKAVRTAEAEMTRLAKRRDEIDRMLADPTDCKVADMGRKPADLMQERGRVEAALEAAESAWLEATEALEAASQAA